MILPSPELKRDKIKHKYWTPKRGYQIKLEYLHKNRWCDSLEVSEHFYFSTNIGDEVEYMVKRGYLGVEWLYTKLSLKN